jgi:arylsulfatase A-like enzyme
MSSAPNRVTSAVTTLALLAPLLAGCGSDSGPEWIQVAGAERVAGGRYSTAGFRIPGGGARELVVDVPRTSTLRLAASCTVAPDTDGAAEGRLRVVVDGEQLTDTALVPGAPATHLTLELRAGTARLRFETDGAGLVVAVHAPVIGPVASERNDDTPRDVVVFLADTFRADNLTVYGGELALTPNIDAFAEGSRVYERTWAPSAWTLPSHASLFLGLHAFQHGAVEHGDVPAERLTSIAEQLAAAGYRTVAITDTLYVSRRFGLDRGFEWFEEHANGTMDETLRAVRDVLAADDGRPLFLFVQTYRTHEPYRVSDATRAEHGERLGIDRTWDELRQGLVDEFVTRIEAGDPEAAEVMRTGDYLTALRDRMEELASEGEQSPFMRSMRALYHGGVIDLDRRFADFMGALERHGIPERGWLVFTSDHGEAFAEHGTVFHGHGVWEEVMRVPLLVRGPDLAPGRSTRGATLVDLTRTLAEMAGVEPAPGWGGRSLLADDLDGPVIAFDCAQKSESQALLVLGDRKFVVPATAAGIEGRELLHAFDLARDPGERDDLAGKQTADDETVLARLCAEAARLLEARAEAGEATLDAATLQMLRDNGYAGD